MARPSQTNSPETKQQQSVADTERKRMSMVLRILRREYPDASCALSHSDPLQLLIATILSAQCTDEQVNRVTPGLFAAYPTAQALSSAPVESIENLVRSTGFYKNKAKNIKACAAALCELHDGMVPSTIEELTSLPGVGRKTANVVLGHAFGLPGLPVDTHVGRLAQLLGFSASGDPVQIETDLCALVPKKSWTETSDLLIFHGRRVCAARKPACERCAIAGYCPSRRTGNARQIQETRNSRTSKHTEKK
jgi:endonuclease-3